MNGHVEPPVLARPQIELDASAGTLRVNDPRLIAKDRRTFCRRLAMALAQKPEIRKSTIDLASASCRVEFQKDSADKHTMAAAFSDAVRSATKAALDGDGTPWWQPSTNWVALSAYPLANEISLWETLEASPGRIRIRHQGLADDFERLSRIANAISHLDTVRACKAVPWSHRLTIDFQPDNGVAEWYVDEAERAFEHDALATASKPEHAVAPLNGEAHHDGVPKLATGAARHMYLAIGAGGLVMSIVGAILPGIPTVPFLLLASYGFARSSPRMDEWLRTNALFGPILVEWEEHGGLGWNSKEKLIGLTIVLVVITLVVVPFSPIGLVVALLLTAISIYGLVCMPGVPGDQAGTLALGTSTSTSPTGS
jgi:uncharacterized membrane protein YbaN (DUF454 family)